MRALMGVDVVFVIASPHTILRERGAEPAVAALESVRSYTKRVLLMCAGI